MEEKDKTESMVKCRVRKDEENVIKKEVQKNKKRKAKNKAEL
jgi:hypothetical protein